jgi:hypothetical protein
MEWINPLDTQVYFTVRGNLFFFYHKSNSYFDSPFWEIYRFDSDINGFEPILAYFGKPPDDVSNVVTPSGQVFLTPSLAERAIICEMLDLSLSDIERIEKGESLIKEDSRKKEDERLFREIREFLESKKVEVK